MKKSFISFFLCLTLVCTALSGCSVKTAKSVTDKICRAAENYVESGTVAENGGLGLIWDAERMALLVKRDGETVWASMPLKQYTDKTAANAVMKHLESQLIVEYIAGTTGSTVDTVTSYNGAVENGRVYSYLLKDGIRILYCFDDLFFAIPVEYRLKNGYLDVKIDLEQIYECTNRITKISVLPYAGGIDNVAENKIFMPDGSGMIMNCDSLRAGRTYSGSVYGEDKIEAEKYKFLDNAGVKLPVYALSDASGKTSCVIIDKNEAAAVINAGAGDETFGYSYAYTTFNVRGTKTITIPGSYERVSVSNQYSKLTDKLSIGERIYFIDDYDPEFISTAECYRNYLTENTEFSGSDNDASVYLDVPMALQQKEFVFGLPYRATKAITTYEAATEVLTAFVSEFDAVPIVRLKGIQAGGLDVTKVAGGFKTEKALGSKKELSSLLSEMQKMGITVFPDFDISRFNSSSADFKVSSSAACNATGMKSIQYFYKVSTGVGNENAKQYYLLSPSKLGKAADKLDDMLEQYGFNGVSLSTLSSSYYSDYKNNDNYIGAGYVKAIKAINTSYKEQDIALMYEAANQYAAVGASYIVDAPLGTSGYAAEDYWLPFYQMVFKGYIPMSSSSLNLADNGTSELLKAIQCGIGLKFTVCGTETAEYANSSFKELMAGSYENCKEQISDFLSKGKSTIDMLHNAKIVGFERIDDGICKTEFDNGCAVIVNYTGNSFVYMGNTIEAQGFILMKGE